jgi:hypothetical protein
MPKIALIGVVTILALFVIVRVGSSVVGQVEARFLPTPTPTPLPTPTPIPAVECDEAINLVFQSHPDAFRTMQSDMHLTLVCGDPTPNRNRSVFLNWSWAGQQHFAEFSISPTRAITPVDENAHRFDTYGSYGNKISVVMKYFN